MGFWGFGLWPTSGQASRGTKRPARSALLGLTRQLVGGCGAV